MHFLTQSDLGIIGGADGPTAIFVSNFPMGLIAIGAVALIAIAALSTKNR